MLSIPTMWHSGAALLAVHAPHYRHVCTCPSVRMPFVHVCPTLLPCSPHPRFAVLASPHLVRMQPCYHACSFCRARPPCTPSFAMRTLLCCACPMCVPPLTRTCSYPCSPPQYKFHKVVVQSTTSAFGPSTTEKWLIARCMGGDHTFYTHSHEHIHRCGCMHVRFHMIYLFIINAC
jgi:hypothetical protein